MGMSAVARHWTREEVLALPDDGNRYELVDGELLVSPSPRGLHQRGIVEIFRSLDPFIRKNRLGAICLAPADLDLRSGHLVQPDLFVGRMVRGREPIEWDEFGIPILVLEVVSPATARYDRVTKRRLYQRAGVPTYWIVDLDARLVEIWTPEAVQPVIAEDHLTWHPEPAIPPLKIDLPALFGRILGDPPMD